MEICVLSGSINMYFRINNKLIFVLWVLIFLVLRTSSYTQSTSSSLVLTDGCPECSIFSTGAMPLLNLKNHPRSCIIPIFSSQNATFKFFKVSVVFFSLFWRKSDALMLFLPRRNGCEVGISYPHLSPALSLFAP